jgi:hypothetical protein
VDRATFVILSLRSWPRSKTAHAFTPKGLKRRGIATPLSHERAVAVNKNLVRKVVK